MTWQFIINPRAGRGRSAYSDVVSATELRRIDADFHETADVADLDHTIRAAVEVGHRRFVVVGGDGTAHHAVNSLMAQQQPGIRFTLSIIAAGSGSDFVRTFGQSGGLDAGLERLKKPDLYPIDVGHIEGSFGSRYFLNAANVGVAAASAKAADALPRFIGSPKYTIAFWLALVRFPIANIDVSVDRHAFSGTAINVVAANGQFFGGGLNIAPKASTGDGILDVQVFRGAKRSAFSVMPRILVGSHLTHKGVRRYVGSKISITAPDSWPIEADGETVGFGSCDVGVLHKAIDYVV
ncbi:MAG: diacylglycerol/lipid kinase family protein [Acidimicrobiia bacterium]